MIPLLVALGLAPHTADGASLEPITNNAVAGIEREGRTYFYTFNGLGAGKTGRDTSAVAWQLDPATGTAKRLADVPGGIGRLASTAVTVGARVYIFGGYSIAPDGSEKSTPEVFAFDPATGQYEARAAMPTPVDDAVAVLYRGRYIYLVSGWHDTGNVALVQVLDTRENRWFEATAYPGTPVFGHAGGIVGETLVIADGVKGVRLDDGRPAFVISGEAYAGEIDASDPSVISWRALPPHPGKPLYRMAATGVAERGLILFAGGGENPYNYNGIGYDGVPSRPSDAVFGFDVGADGWRQMASKPRATMDHRGLLRFGRQFCTLGGMAGDQRVIADIDCFDAILAD